MKPRLLVPLGALVAAPLFASLFSGAEVVKRAESAPTQAPRPRKPLSEAARKAIAPTPEERAQEMAANAGGAQATVQTSVQYTVGKPVGMPQGGRLMRLPNGRLVFVPESATPAPESAPPSQPSTQAPAAPEVASPDPAAENFAPEIAQASAAPAPLSQPSAQAPVVPAPKRAEGRAEATLLDGRVVRAVETPADGAALDWSLQVPGERVCVRISAEDIAESQVRLPDGRVVRAKTAAEIQAERDAAERAKPKPGLFDRAEVLK